MSPSSNIPVTTTSPQDSPAPQDSTAATDSLLPPVDSAAPADTTAPTDSTPVISTLGAAAGGIVFGTIQLPTSQLNTIQTGTLYGGQIDTTNALALLKAIQAKRGRLIIKMSMGADKWIKNADGTFSFTKWKLLVDRFKKINLEPFIRDGTIEGHYLIDEPSRTVRWGGKIISQATIEAMAKYSKSIWRDMPTFARVIPSWLEAATPKVTYVHLDAAWLQYETFRGDVTKVLTAEVAAAKRQGLGLAVGLNVLDGGNGTSRIPGWTRGKYAMSASELRKYGGVLLSNSYPGSYSCTFYNWMWDSPYYSRPDIKIAMSELATKARNHVRTNCRQ